MVVDAKGCARALGLLCVLVAALSIGCTRGFAFLRLFVRLLPTNESLNPVVLVKFVLRYFKTVGMITEPR
jgi:hypothetical protein